jgi:hypothetical protein
MINCLEMVSSLGGVCACVCVYKRWGEMRVTCTPTEECVRAEARDSQDQEGYMDRKKIVKVSHVSPRELPFLAKF